MSMTFSINKVFYIFDSNTFQESLRIIRNKDQFDITDWAWYTFFIFIDLYHASMSDIYCICFNKVKYYCKFLILFDVPGLATFSK